MLTAIVPLSKIGTPFQSPSWRYQAIHSPERFGFSECLSKTKNPDSGHLSRLVPNGILPVNVYRQPIYMQQLNARLSLGLQQILARVWNKHFYRTNSSKLTFNNVGTKETGFISWNIPKLEKINDLQFVRIVKHCYNYEGDPYIGEALKFYKNPDNDISRKWINYSIYGGKTDKELALQWHKPIKFFEALRALFYDYRSWPKDRLVQYSLIRQMVSNGEFDDADYHAFRRIFDLGDLGLRSALGHTAFTVDEQYKIKEYLAGASVDVLLDQRFTISSTRDIMNYNRAVADYANIGLKRLEMEQRAALMRLNCQRTEKELGIAQNTTLESEDIELMEYLKIKTHENIKPVFPTFIDIQSEPVKLVVEKTG